MNQNQLQLSTCFVYTIFSHGIHCRLYTSYVVIALCIFLQTGATPLYIACQNGHSDVVNTLIRNGADISLAFQVHNIIMGLII